MQQLEEQLASDWRSTKPRTVGFRQTHKHLAGELRWERCAHVSKNTVLDLAEPISNFMWRPLPRMWISILH